MIPFPKLTDNLKCPVTFEEIKFKEGRYLFKDVIPEKHYNKLNFGCRIVAHATSSKDTGGKD